MNIADHSTPTSGATPMPSPNQRPDEGQVRRQDQDAPSATRPMTPDTSATAEMVNRVVHGAHEAIDSIAESATPTLERLEQGLSQTGDALHEKAGQLRATGDEWTDSLRESVRQNPLAALAAALAVGVVIARLTR